MKKHITIAALWVAGTSLANAGTANFTFNSPIDGAEMITVASGSTDAITGNLDTVVSGATFSITQGGSKWSSVKGDIMSPYNSGYFKWNNDVALTEISGASGVAVDALKTINQGIGNYFAASTAVPQVVTLSGLTANTDYSITTIWGPVSSRWILNFTKGTFVDGRYGVLNLNSAHSTAWESFDALSGPNSGFTIYGVVTTVRSDESGTISFTGTSNSEIAFLSVSTIPEPSAFGLLAGVGALALAVSRRRRK